MKKFDFGLALFLSSAIAINYLDRVNISHALPVISEELSLSELQQGAILSAFSLGYVGFMAAGGYLADRFGAFKVSGLSVVAWSLATLFTGLTNSSAALYLSRVLIGAGEAPIFPAFASIVRRQFPLQQRGRATAIFDGGSYVGTALSAPIMVGLIALFGWRFAFFFCGVLGLIWALCWVNFLKRRGLQQTKVDIDAKSLTWRRWFAIIRNRKVLSASFGFFTYNYSKSFFLTWFPTYLITERGFSFLQVGVYAIIPPLSAAMGALAAGVVTDRMIAQGFSVTVSRKLPICFGLLSSVVVVPAAIVGSPMASFALLTLAFTFTISASPGIWALPGDIAPKPGLVSVVGSIQNTFSNLAGFIAPLVTGFLVYQSGSFVLPLAFTAVLCGLGALSYWIGVGQLEPISMEEADVR